MSIISREYVFYTSESLPAKTGKKKLGRETSKYCSPYIPNV
jgi:hypothetical protein